MPNEGRNWKETSQHLAKVRVSSDRGEPIRQDEYTSEKVSRRGHHTGYNTPNAFRFYQGNELCRSTEERVLGPDQCIKELKSKKKKAKSDAELKRKKFCVVILDRKVHLYQTGVQR